MSMQLNAREYLADIAETLYTSGNPDENFFYLAGPMSGLPGYNFSEFLRIGALLRAEGFNIISPAEVVGTEHQELVMQSPDGRTPTGIHWTEYMAHDVVIVSMPTCQGGIFMPGWSTSAGACLEGDIISALRKEMFEFHELDGGDFSLSHLDWSAARPKAG